MQQNIVIVLLISVLFCSCNEQTASKHIEAGNDKRAVNQYALLLSDMRKIDVGYGETVYQAEGKDHGMGDLSFVITEIQPGGGPTLHTHPVEEMHVRAGVPCLV